MMKCDEDEDINLENLYILNVDVLCKASLSSYAVHIYAIYIYIYCN